MDEICKWMPSAESIIAGLALVATFIAMARDAKNRRLSVTPHLVAGRVNNENSRSYLLVLQNKGVGPAILESIEVTFDGAPLPMTGKSLRAWSDNFPGRWTVSHYTPTPGTFIAAGEEIEILGIVAHTINCEDPAGLGARLHLVVKYRSLYEERFSEETAPGEH